MTFASSNLEKIAVTCGICHDQCAAACPVVESSRSMVAYPSRLAMLAWELSRGNLPPDGTVLSAMQHCIHCNACTAHCVYIDQPVDVTPLVRHARRQLIEASWETPAMRDLVAQARDLRNPAGDMQRRLRSIIERTAPDDGEISSLILVDAAALRQAPEQVENALHLLAALGWKGVQVAPVLEYGGNLFDYGYLDEARDCAMEATDVIRRTGVQEVLTVGASTAYLLREVYPSGLGIKISARIRTIPEAVLAAMKPGLFQIHPEDKVIMVLSDTENYKAKDRAALDILKACCTVVNDPLPPNLFLRRLSYPDGPVLDLNPDPRLRIMERINRYIQEFQANRVVTTDPSFLKAYQALHHPVPACDIYRYLIDSL